jgi:FkbM family methyltransferase
MDPKGFLQKLARRVGLDVRRYDPQQDAVLRRQLLLEHYRVQLVLDVGANAGQYARQLRRGGYRHRIVSFEPQSSAFELLQKRAAGDPQWSALHVALSDADGTAQINLAGNSLSSSLLGMLPTHAESAPESTYVGREAVTTRRLDGLLPDLAPVGTPTYLKIDTQGSELKVLRGAGDALQHVDTLELELSLVPLYEGAPLFQEMLAWLAERGYELVGLEPAFSDPRSGRLLQADGFFHRPRGA